MWKITYYIKTLLSGFTVKNVEEEATVCSCMQFSETMIGGKRKKLLFKVHFYTTVYVIIDTNINIVMIT
jgi:hypothetical protein